MTKNEIAYMYDLADRAYCARADVARLAQFARTMGPRYDEAFTHADRALTALEGATYLARLARKADDSATASHRAVSADLMRQVRELCGEAKALAHNACYYAQHARAGSARDALLTAVTDLAECAESAVVVVG